MDFRLADEQCKMVAGAFERRDAIALITLLRDQVLESALAVARQLAERPPTAVACAKEALWHALSTALPVGVNVKDRLLQVAASAPERQAGPERLSKGDRS